MLAASIWDCIPAQSRTRAKHFHLCPFLARSSVMQRTELPRASRLPRLSTRGNKKYSTTHSPTDTIPATPRFNTLTATTLRVMLTDMHARKMLLLDIVRMYPVWTGLGLNRTWRSGNECQCKPSSSTSTYVCLEEKSTSNSLPCRPVNELV